MHTSTRLFSAFFFLLSLSTAQASLLTVDYSEMIKSRVFGSVALQSQDGVMIRIEYEKLVSHLLDRASTWARAKTQDAGSSNLIKIELSGDHLNSTDPIRIVFLNYCRSNIYRYQVFEDQNQVVDMKHDVAASEASGTVVFTGFVAGPIVVDQQHPSGQSFHCVQELAVVINGRWLVDPISQKHNFSFMF